MSDKRTKLDTAIEREVHKFICEIREHMYDYTHLFCRRNNTGVSHQDLEIILSVAKDGLNDGELSKINNFHDRIKKVLDEYAGEEEKEAFTNQNQPAPRQPVLGNRHWG
jgi:hypothetical protein